MWEIERSDKIIIIPKFTYAEILPVENVSYKKMVEDIKQYWNYLNNIFENYGQRMLENDDVCKDIHDYYKKLKDSKDSEKPEYIFYYETYTSILQRKNNGDYTSIVRFYMEEKQNRMLCEDRHYHIDSEPFKSVREARNFLYKQ